MFACCVYVPGFRRSVVLFALYDPQAQDAWFHFVSMFVLIFLHSLSILFYFIVVLCLLGVALPIRIWSTTIPRGGMALRNGGVQLLSSVRLLHSLVYRPSFSFGFGFSSIMYFLFFIFDCLFPASTPCQHMLVWCTGMWW